MGGYGLPGGLAAVGVLGGINAVLAHIWSNPSGLILWLIIVGGAVLGLFAVEAINRRNFVEVNGGRVRWALRQPPSKGELSVSSLRQVEVLPSGTRLVFEREAVSLYASLFRKRDMTRLVNALQQLGTQVTETQI